MLLGFAAAVTFCAIVVPAVGIGDTPRAVFAWSGGFSVSELEGLLGGWRPLPASWPAMVVTTATAAAFVVHLLLSYLPSHGRLSPVFDPSVRTRFRMDDLFFTLMFLALAFTMVSVGDGSAESWRLSYASALVLP